MPPEHNSSRPRQQRHPVTGVVLLTAGVAIAALTLGLGSGNSDGAWTGSGAHGQATAVASSTAPSFAGGMRGEVMADFASFSGPTGSVWLVQRIGAVAEYAKTVLSWQATTTNGGASWTVIRRRRWIGGPVAWEAKNGWAGSYRNGRASRFTATHDSGKTWSAVSMPRALLPDQVTVSRGAVWATTTRCTRPFRCVYPVLRGSASGSRLRRVPAASPNFAGDLSLIAVSHNSAYMYHPAGDAGARRAWITHNAGRTWTIVGPGCRENLGTAFATSGDSHGTIWRACAPDSQGHQKLGISTDGGRRWVYRSTTFPTPNPITSLYPDSRRIAWAQNKSGDTLRTTDGGRSWHTVQTVKHPRNASPGPYPSLTPRSATVATEVVPVTHTDMRDHHTLTNLLVYRTADGGTHWQRSPVPLPHGA